MRGLSNKHCLLTFFICPAGIAESQIKSAILLFVYFVYTRLNIYLYEELYPVFVFIAGSHQSLLASKLYGQAPRLPV